MRSPTTPRPDWQWDESLLLYQPQLPYEKAIYLMPLGFRYRHRDVSSKAKPLPGLLDSVRWKQKQVASILQRTYQEAATPDWQFAAEKLELRQNIERLVQELCENFAFKPPLTETQPLVILPQFDLQHDRIAKQVADNTIARPLELDRVLLLLKQSPSQRLLLEGQSGSGKSVLLAQLFLAERERAVFVSMDAKPEPLAEAQEMGQFGLQQKTSNAAEPQPGPEQNSNILTDDNEMAVSSARGEQASVALRVGMYCLTVLNQLMQLPPPNEVLSVPKVQDALRDNLAYFAQQQPQAYFLVILDGANQAPDAGGLLGGLPDPLPSNLYLLVSSQPQQRVRQPLTLYGHQQWAFTDITQLAPAEAEAMVWHYWTRDLAGQPTPKRAELSAHLLQRVCEASQNVPIFLEDWTRRLRAYWADHQATFATTAEAYFEQHYATALPIFLRERLEAVKQPFEPARLLDAVLWCFSLIQKSLTLETLVDAIQALRQHGPFAALPAISKSQLEDGLSALGGFLRRLHQGFEERWQLSHEVLGQWFCEQHGRAEDLPGLRLSLVPFGAVPLPEKASEKEIEQWTENVETENVHYSKLSTELKISVLDSLSFHLPKQSLSYASILPKYSNYLHKIGEHQRAFSLLPKLQELSNINPLNFIQYTPTVGKYIEQALKVQQKHLFEQTTIAHQLPKSLGLYSVEDVNKLLGLDRIQLFSLQKNAIEQEFARLEFPQLDLTQFLNRWKT
jgi:hypothetical protein